MSRDYMKYDGKGCNPPYLTEDEAAKIYAESDGIPYTELETKLMVENVVMKSKLQSLYELVERQKKHTIDDDDLSGYAKEYLEALYCAILKLKQE